MEYGIEEGQVSGVFFLSWVSPLYIFVLFFVKGGGEMAF